MKVIRVNEIRRMKEMELVTEDMFDRKKKGIFENWVCNRDHLDKLLRLDNKSYYAVDIKELRSEAERPTGCVYGLNKIFVAGHLPLKAEEKGERIIIKHTGKFDEDLYATKVTIKKRTRGETPYEQPSSHQIKRVQRWLDNNGYKSK